MSEVFLEREFDPPIGRSDVYRMARYSANCFGIYRVDWHASLLSLDGRFMVCHFSSADAESVRMALRQTGTDYTKVWPGTVHEAPGRDAGAMEPANVLVTRSWEEPVELDDIQAIEDGGAWCLGAHGVKFVRTFFSGDRRRMICLYHAPDAEAVRQSQAQAGMPFDRVWAFQAIGAGDPDEKTTMASTVG